MKKLLVTLFVCSVVFGSFGQDASARGKKHQNSYPGSYDNRYDPRYDNRYDTRSDDQAPVGQLNECIRRVLDSGCYLSKNDQRRIQENVQKCKHVESASGKTELEIFLLDESDKVVVFETKGNDRYGSYCPLTKYNVDNSGIKDMKVISNRVFLLSNDGNLFMMHSDETFYEILNSRAESYTSIKSIAGVDGGTAIELKFKQGGRPLVLTREDINEKINPPKKHYWSTPTPEARKLNFYRYSTNESLFRDR